MTQEISLEDKRAFIKYVLGHYPMPIREAQWILNYLLNHEIVLNKTHFVENAHMTPRGIKISTQGPVEQAFRFYKNGKAFTNPEQAFHDIRLNWHENLYVDVQIPNAFSNLTYLAVIEDNPFYDWNQSIPVATEARASWGMDEFLQESQREVFLEKIHGALELGDEEAFMKWSDLLKDLDHTDKEEVEDSWNNR